MSMPTSSELHAIKNLKQIAREECILPGTTVCSGCGGLEALRLAAKVLGPKTVFVNAAGCFTLLAVFPYTPFKGSWLYTTMASAAAGAQGVRDALDVLLARGKMAPEEDIEVVVVAGDGSALRSTYGNNASERPNDRRYRAWQKGSLRDLASASASVSGHRVAALPGRSDQQVLESQGAARPQGVHRACPMSDRLAL
jgi:hypothetical protein